MRKVLLFSAFLLLGLFLSQTLPIIFNDTYHIIKSSADILLYICLGFIMINVGREFDVDKSRWKSYTEDYFIAMATAAMPWILITLYFIFVLLPSEFWNSWEAWKENLLLSRFAAPTSAGILFTMLTAIGLQKSWIYKKIQVLAIFDDLDTILLMIPLQIMMIGLRWQLGIIVLIVFALLAFGWKKMGSYEWKQNWISIILYSIVVFAITQIVYLSSKHLWGEDGSIHIEVLLPAFVVGMIMKHKHISSKTEENVSTFISFLFMLLVGMSMPRFIGVDFFETTPNVYSIVASQPMLSWGEIAMHVVFVSILSNIGKLFPLFFYRDRKISERLALSIGMFTRGEVGAGVIFIALGYNLGGPVLIISVLTIVLNLIFTSIFVLWVKKLAIISYR